MRLLCLDSNNEESRVKEDDMFDKVLLCLDSNNEESRVESLSISSFTLLCLDSNNEESRVRSELRKISVGAALIPTTRRAESPI